MLDAFGPIGGHNFSWAWSTGRAAGLAPPGTRGVERHRTRGQRLPRLLLLVFSGWSVYTRYFDLNAFDLVTRCRSAICRCRSTTTRSPARGPFPINGACSPSGSSERSNRSRGLDPHAIDVVLKTLALAASTALLYVFATTIVSAVGAILAAVLYLFVTAAAFSSEGYAIYFTNDYLAVLSWFAGALAIRHRAWMLAALAAFVGAWAKETARADRVSRHLRSVAQARPVERGGRCARSRSRSPPRRCASCILRRSHSGRGGTRSGSMCPFVTWEGPVIMKALRDNLKVHPVPECAVVVGVASVAPHPGPLSSTSLALTLGLLRRAGVDGGVHP